VSKRNRLENEVGKGVESLRTEQVNLVDVTSGSVTYRYVVGPFDVDVDVVDVQVTAGSVPAGTGNTLNIYNGPVANNKTIISAITMESLTLQVPTTATITQANARVPAGTPIVVSGAFPGNNSATPAVVSVTIDYEIPINDPAARVTTYGAYVY
jgi:hypothetical protein